MMQRKHSSEAMTGAPGALPGEAIRAAILVVAAQASTQRRVTGLWGRLILAPFHNVLK